MRTVWPMLAACALIGWGTLFVGVRPSGAEPAAANAPAAGKAAPAADSSSPGGRETAYAALAQSRLKAELAIRRLRAYFDENDGAWRSAALACEQAHSRLENSIARAQEQEQRKPDDQRNQGFIDDCVQKRQAVQQDWERFANVSRPAMESAYRATQTLTQQIQSTYQSLASTENSWKDAGGDLAPLAAMYDAIAKRADEVRAQAEKATGDLQSSQKTWEAAADAAVHAPDKAG